MRVEINFLKKSHVTKKPMSRAAAAAVSVKSLKHFEKSLIGVAVFLYTSVAPVRPINFVYLIVHFAHLYLLLDAFVCCSPTNTLYNIVKSSISSSTSTNNNFNYMCWQAQKPNPDENFLSPMLRFPSCVEVLLGKCLCSAHTHGQRNVMQQASRNKCFSLIIL